MTLDYSLTEFIRRTGVCGITAEEYWTADSLTYIRPHLLTLVQDLSEETVMWWTWAILSAADVRLDLRGVLAGEDVLRFLLTWHLRNSLVQNLPNTPPESNPWEPDLLDAPIAHRVCDALFTALHALAPHRKAPLLEIPWQKDAEVFTFHLQAFPHTRRQPCALYETCGPLLGTRLFQLDKRNEPETQKWYATPPRSLFKHFPHADLSAPIIPLTRERFLQLVALSHPSFRKQLRRSDDPDAVIQSHTDRLTWLFDTRLVGSRKHGGPSDMANRQPKKGATYDRESQPLEDLPSDTTPNDLTVASLRPLNIEEGVDCEDWNNDGNLGGGDQSDSREQDPLIRPPEIWVFPPSKSIVPSRPSLSTEDTYRAIGHNFPRFWDPLRGGLGPHRLVAWLRQVDRWYRTGIRDGRLLFPLLPLWYGWDRYDIADMQIAVYPTDEDGDTPPRDRLLVDPWRRVFFYFQIKAQGRSSFRPSSLEGWRSSTRWIALPIARALSRLVKANTDFLHAHGLLQDGQRFLQVVTPQGTVVPLTPRRFEYLTQQDLS